MTTRNRAGPMTLPQQNIPRRDNGVCRGHQSSLANDLAQSANGRKASIDQSFFETLELESFSPQIQVTFRLLISTCLLEEKYAL